ncbi:MAG: VIT domain-containing protein [Candidatus Competibacter sp.]
MNVPNRLISLFGLLCLVASLATGVRASETPDASDDKTLSPYFLITTPDAEVDQFALKDTRAEVNIAGVIADVKITQVYQNHGQKPLEAIYVFPASTRAAVYGMKMTIGERTIVAKIDKREQARADYEQAKAEGRSASLLEQQRPNVFQMNVANLLPGDEIKVEMQYTELLTPRQRLYEFVYPTVVGPRYSNQPAATAPASDRWVQNPYLKPGEQRSKTPYRFDLRLTLNAGLPIQDIASPSHKVTVAYAGPAQATITLDRAETDGGNRDFIAKYRLAGNQVESGLLLYRGEQENFFLLMMQPPTQVAAAQIPPREYLFVVDVSGSMHGFPLDLSKKLLQDLIGHLRPTDWFNILLFAGQSAVLAERSLPATPDHLQRALDLLDRQQGGGGTELLPALRRALQLPRPEGVSRTVIIATDGYVDIEKDTFEVIRNHLGEANLFAFGIGSSVNRFLIEGLARAGMGEPFIITQPDQAAAKAAEFRQLIQTPVLTGIQVQYDGFDAYDQDPLRIPDVFAERPVVVVGKWRGEPKGEIVVSGVRGGEPYRQTFKVAEAQPSPANAALRYLWARSRIAWLDDNNRLDRSDARIQEVTDLGLKYNLLTAYTSFVAIDSEVRLKDGQATTVRQPLPLPEGVPESAVNSQVMGGLLGAAPRMMMAESLRPREALSPATPAPTKPAMESWKLEKVTVLSGTISRKAIQATFAHDRAIGRCAMPAEAKPGQRLILMLTVNAQGEVTEVKPADSAPTTEPWIKCLVEAIKAWRWQRAGGGQEARIRLELKVRA